MFFKKEKCPICGYYLSDCQCLYAGSCHPNRSDNRRIVLDHLYKLTPKQLKHIISLESQWEISYSDSELNNKMNEMFKK